MFTKTLTLGGAAALALAGGIVLTTPAFAWTHHQHRTHATHASLSSPAEKQQTADLNRQQLTQSGAAGTQSATGTPSNSGLTTQPTTYERSPSSAGSPPPAPPTESTAPTGSGTETPMQQPNTTGTETSPPSGSQPSPQ